jgi:glycosyltransferase involved in cell wall biosynthesis
MRVIRVTTLLDFGGVEKRLVNTARHHDNDIEFIFVSLGKGGWAEKEITKLGSRVILLHHPYKIPNFSLIKKLIDLFKREKPDVVHTSGAEANFHGAIAAWYCNIPVVVAEEIGFPRHGLLARTMFTFVYHLTDRVIAISEAVKNKLVAIGEVKASKCVVIYNPLSLPDAKHTRRGDMLQLLIVSRLEPIKNIPPILDFLGRHKHELPMFLLTIVGEGSERLTLEKQARELGLQANIRFTGFQADPSPFYRQADIFLLPSFSEGLSNALQEAMGTGLVCLATREGGPAELINDGINGFLIDPHDHHQIGSGLEKAMKLNADECRVIGERARETVAEKFSLKRYIESLKQAYRKPE